MIPIYDSGHGFETAGKESAGFINDKGDILLKENNVNEAICNKVSLLYYLFQEEFHFVSNEWNDISLQERVNREKAIAKEVSDKGLESFFISVHADAFKVKDAATGGRFFYYSETGRVLAEFFTSYLRDNGYMLSLREPAKGNFKVLRDTQSPAILFELGFMTTKSDLDVLRSEEFRNHTALLLYDAGRCYSEQNQ